MTNIIEVQNLTFTYHGASKPALNNINLKVRKGELVAITGHTGSGKSTLLYTLNGLIPHVLKGRKNGKVFIKGMDVDKHPPEELARTIGVVFEDPETQLTSLTVEDEVAFGLENISIPREEMVERIKWALNIVRLPFDKFKNRAVTTLSGGEKQRLAIASILAMKPEILLFDEITAHLDPLGKKEISEVIDTLRKLGEHTIIWSELNTAEIANHADRVIILKDGKIILEGPPYYVFRKVSTTDVKPPQITELAIKLKIEPVIKLEEAEKVFQEYLKKVKNQINLSFEGKESFQIKSDSSIIIDINHLYFGYEKDKYVLEDINLKIRKGEFIALVGQNGSGKTTLAKIIMGLLKPSSGDIKIFGKDIRESKLIEIAQHIGLVFQHPESQLFEATVEKDVSFALRNLNLPKDEINKRVEDVLRICGIEELRKADPLLLGLGQKRRVGIASVLVMHPEVIILDEPTSGQDWFQSIEIMDMLKELNKKGHTIIFITHDMELVAQYATRVVVLHNGKILFDGPTREVFKKVEFLNSISLGVPQIVELFYKLNLPIALTIEEATEFLLTH